MEKENMEKISLNFSSADDEKSVERNEYRKDDFLSLRQRRVKSFTVFYCFFCHGTVNALLGATLLDLQILLDCDTQKISTMYTWRHLGMAAGCLLAGRITDRTNQHAVQAVATSMMAVTLGSAPWTEQFVAFAALMTVQGFFSGMHSVGTGSFIMDIWDKKCGPYLQILHLSVMLGATICPQVVKLFVKTSRIEEITAAKNNTVSESHYNESLENNITLLFSGTNGNDILNSSIFYIPNGDNNTYIENTTTTLSIDKSSSQTEPLTAGFHTNVAVVYLYISVLISIGTLLHTLNLFFSGCSLKHISASKIDQPEKLYKSKSSDPEKSVEYNQGPSKRKVYLSVSIMVLIITCFSGLEDILGQFSPKYAVEELGWEMTKSRDLVSAFWGAAALSRMISTPLSLKLQPSTLTGLCTAFATIFSMVLFFTVKLTDVALWVGVIFVGLSIGSLFPHVLNMGKSLIKYNGVLNSILFLSMYFSKMSAPPLVGYMLQNFGYDWYLYWSVIFTLGMSINYCVLFLVTRYTT